MADPARKRSPTPNNPPNSSAEDPDTAAARKELRHTAISDKPDLAPAAMSSAAAAAAERKATPERDASAAPDDSLKEQISSPKKKRAHDELEEGKEPPKSDNGDVSPVDSIDRSARSEPEKKRPRDVSSEANPPATASGSAPDTKDAKPESKPTETTAADTADSKTTANKESTDTKPESSEKKATSAAAFGASGLSGFASQSSPFLSAAGSKPLSSFASGSSSASPFAAVGATSGTSAFGSGSLSGSASPFGQIGGASKPFGSSALGGSAFGSALGGGKLTSFGSAGGAFKNSKPAKPFGAPESDNEEDDEDDEDGNTEADKETNDGKDGDDDSTTTTEDKKKPKLQRVALDDGETAEATILQVRAKAFYLDKETKSWKERGAGNLKINVPHACVDFDDNDAVLPGSFDASALEDADSKMVRLIMRQDSTHRVILNTSVYPAMHFEEKQTTKAVCVLFTAIGEGAEPVPMQIKMSPANAKSFLNEIQKIQRELQSV